MAGFDLTALNNFLKHDYIPPVVEFQAFEEHPALAMIRKDEKFGAGSGNGTKELTIGIEHPQGGSASFAQAQTNADKSAPKGGRMSLTNVDLYQIARIPGKVVRLSNDNKHIMLDVARTKVDGVIKALGRKLAVQLYRDGWGILGQVGAINTTTKVITLSNPQDVVNFALGETIVGSTTAATAVLLGSAATAEITGVNYEAGTLTYSGNTLGNALGGGHYLFAAGDRQDSATPDRVVVSGFGAWAPDTAPGATDSFFGANRSVSSRLFGPAVDVAGLTVREAITKGLQRVRVFGGRPDVLFLNTEQYGQLVTEMQNFGRFEMQEMKAGSKMSIGIPFFTVYTQFGGVKVIDDPECPVNRGYLLKMDTWELGSTGPAIGLLVHGDKGQQSLAVANADAVEVRIGGYPQVYCTAPGYNAVLKFA